jgi:hypothetical protein
LGIWNLAALRDDWPFSFIGLHFYSRDKVKRQSEETKSQQPPPIVTHVGGSQAGASNAWAIPVMWMVIVLTLVGAAIYVLKSCVTGEKKLVEQIVEVASAFKQGTVTTTFTSYAATVGGSQYFQFAHLSEKVVFTRTDEKSYGWGYLPLPDVVVEANAPVTFTYYLDLNDKWDFHLQNGVIEVLAPRIKYNKPAVDVSKIDYTVKKDSVFRNTKEAMENLRASITGICYRKAEENIPVVRETGRKQTELFVQNWLAKSFTDGKKYTVKVRFRGESAPNLGSGQTSDQARP